MALSVGDLCFCKKNNLKPSPKKNTEDPQMEKRAAIKGKINYKCKIADCSNISAQSKSDEK